MQSSQRHIWLLTYQINKTSITSDTFTNYGRLAIDECYTTSDYVIKYTLVHLKVKNRNTALQKFMTYCHQKYNIISQDVSSYPSVSASSCSNELMKHPGFKLLAEHMKESNPNFSSWIETPGLRGGGILAAFNRKQTTTSAFEYPLMIPIFSKNAIDNCSDFDVVKKRRVMDAISPTPVADDNPEALSTFEDFERNVLPALEAIREDELKNQRKELEELEENISKGLTVSTTGGVYFAWSSCLNCMKIGATRRDDPNIRLRELSRHVTTPFTLVGWIPTPTPFRLESVAHAHFASARIRHTGAGTEFFDIGVEMVEAYCKNNV